MLPSTPGILARPETALNVEFCATELLKLMSLLAEGMVESGDERSALLFDKLEVRIGEISPIKLIADVGLGVSDSFLGISGVRGTG